MSRRFFAEYPVVGETLVISNEQAHHMAKVMRFKPGEQVTLFDGSGKEYSAELIEVGKKKVSLRVISVEEPVRQISRHLTLAVALPKGDRQKFLIEKLVELGVSKFIPLVTARGVSAANEKSLSRIEKQVIEACKQCGRNTLMEVSPERSLEQVMAQAQNRMEYKTASQNDDSICLIASPGSPQFVSQLISIDTRRIVVAVGPEGGFEQQELRRAIETGWLPVSLGPSILRIETAAIAMAAILGVGQPSRP